MNPIGFDTPDLREAVIEKHSMFLEDVIEASELGLKTCSLLVLLSEAHLRNDPNYIIIGELHLLKDTTQDTFLVGTIEDIIKILENNYSISDAIKSIQSQLIVLYPDKIVTKALLAFMHEQRKELTSAKAGLWMHIKLLRIEIQRIANVIYSEEVLKDLDETWTKLSSRETLYRKSSSSEKEP